MLSEKNQRTGAANDKQVPGFCIQGIAPVCMGQPNMAAYVLDLKLDREREFFIAIPVSSKKFNCRVCKLGQKGSHHTHAKEVWCLECGGVSWG